MAEIAVQSIDVDLTPGGVTPILYVSQGDYGSRKLIFNLLLNGQPYTIPSSVRTVSLEGASQTGNVFRTTCEFNGSQVTSSLITDMTTDAGLDLCQLLFTNSDESRLGTANFFIAVEKSPTTVKVLYTNIYWTELAKSWAVGGTGLRDNEAAENSKYQATLSKSWAIGGTNLIEDEDTNNARYFASIVNDVRPQLDENTNAVSVLEALINQYVVPSEQHPDEVVNARVGFDGVLYNTLGDAVRAQATKYGYIPGSEEIYFRHN